MSDKPEVFVVLVCFGVVWQQVGDGVVTATLRVRRHVHNVLRVGCVQYGDGGFGALEESPNRTGHLVVRAPHTNLHGVGSGSWENVVDGVVVEPYERRLTARSIELGGNDERRVDRARLFQHGLVGERCVVNQLSRFSPVVEDRRDPVEKGRIGAWCNRIGVCVAGMCIASTVERITTNRSGVARRNLSNGREGSDGGGVNGIAAAVEIVGCAEQPLQFSAVGVDVFPRDKRVFRCFVKHHPDVLRLKVFGRSLCAMVCMNATQGKKGKQHDCR